MVRDALGKPDPAYFENVIYKQLGAARDEVIHGPKVGFDNGSVDIGGGNVLVVTTDPLSYIPELGPRDSAWISAHLLASDLVTSGLMPQYAVVSLNLPPQLNNADFEVYWHALHSEFEKMGVAVVAGHTGRYPGIDFTIVGSGTLMAIGPRDSFLSPDQAKPGDAVLITKGAMVGTSGLLARVFPKTLEAAVDAEFVSRVQQLFSQYPTFPDARAAISVGIRDEGVTAMHDVTEGGTLGALYEFARAAGCGVVVEIEKIPVSQDVRRMCELFELDPYSSLSEGSLLITTRPQSAQAVVEALTEAHIECAQIGELKQPNAGLKLFVNGSERPLEAPHGDRYWEAYARFMSEEKKRSTT